MVVPDKIIGKFKNGITCNKCNCYYTIEREKGKMVERCFNCQVKIGNLLK